MKIYQNESNNKYMVLHIQHEQLFEIVDSIVVLENVVGFGFSVISQDTFNNHEKACQEFIDMCKYWLD